MVSEWQIYVAIGLAVWALVTLNKISKEVRDVHIELRDLRARFDSIFPVRQAEPDDY